MGSDSYGGKGDNSYYKFKVISEELKAIMRKYDCVGLTAAQMNRMANEVHVADLQHLRESIGIHDIMNAVIMVDEPPGYAEHNYQALTFRKNRMGKQNMLLVMQVDKGLNRVLWTGEHMIYSGTGPVPNSQRPLCFDINNSVNIDFHGPHHDLLNKVDGG